MARDPDKPTIRARINTFRERAGMIWQVFTITRKRDKLLVPLMLGAFLAPILIAAIVSLFIGYWGQSMPLGVALGALAGMVIFTRRATKAQYDSMAGQPGAALGVIQQMRGGWISSETPVQFNAHQDMIHRVLGKPGVVLVGEGNTNRLKHLFSQEMKRVSRVTGGIEIYRVVVGSEEGQVPLDKLQRHFLKLPRNLTGKQVTALQKRMVAISGPNMPIPKGPMPKGARMPKSARSPRT
ncbi:DUF4191 domain-containing protein [Fodinicola feengrottensis]|uniref:DUF4191 domain-containing protein n=1 Tax=Fodinicola feengrottensis TaxID=435914 RepID=A0ABN2HP84_9ACTN|nr:DUF4191 domain-containing protein [Fodinicola feengrottensis]